MAKFKIDAIAVTSEDMASSVAFYRLLGVEFPPFSAQDQHVEGRTQGGGVRLMIDAADLAEQLIGTAPKPANLSQFAILCECPAVVDETVTAVQDAGFEVVTPAFDAFWGQRYATVADPAGYRVDLFAPL